MIWRRPIKEKLIFQLHEAYTHILATGRPGAGKTSFLTPVQRQLIKQGAFCLHCCVKPDEAWRAEQLIRSTGKTPTRFSPDSGHIFNPLTYEMSRKGGSARSLSAFHIELNEVMTRSSSERSEDFWKSGTIDLQTATFELVFLVKGQEATYRDAYDVLMSIPNNPEHAKSEAFRESTCGQFLDAALRKNPQTALPIADLMLKRIPSTGDKAKAAFQTQAITSIQPFVFAPLCNAVNGVSTLTPDQMLERYVILDFDTLTFGINGLALQLLVSWFCMEEVLRRRSWKRPFMLVRDEYHQLAQSRRDIQVMSVGRSQGFFGLSAFQTVPVLEDSLGAGLEAQTQAKALIGLHVNKIYCNNNCHVTNEFAAMAIGQERKIFFGGSNAPDPQQAGWSDVLGVGNRPTFSFNQQFHFRVDPLEFTRLKTGGKHNNYEVSAIITRGTHDYEYFTTNQRYK